MKVLRFTLFALLLAPVGAWADVSYDFYKVECQPELGRFNVIRGVEAADESNGRTLEYLVELRAKQGFKLLRPKMEYEYDESGYEYATNLGEQLPDEQCTLQGRVFTVELFGLHNFTAIGRNCSQQGPSLKVTVKDEDQTVVKDVEMRNGCFGPFRVGGLTYLAGKQKGHGGLALRVGSGYRSEEGIKPFPYISIGSGKYEVPMVEDDGIGYFSYEIVRRLFLDPAFYKEYNYYTNDF